MKSAFERYNWGTPLLNPDLFFLSIEIIEDVAESPAPPAQLVSVVSPPSQEKEAYKRLGLTKQVLAAHTQKEEQAFLSRCRELLSTRSLQKGCSNHDHKQKGPSATEGKHVPKHVIQESPFWVNMHNNTRTTGFGVGILVHVPVLNLIIDYSDLCEDTYHTFSIIIIMVE